MSRSLILVALAVILVVIIFLVPVALSDDGRRADPERSDGLETVSDLLRSLPGLGNELEADDVDVACFDATQRRFVVDQAEPTCQLRLDEGVDAVPLGVASGQCRVRISDQPGTFDESFATADWEDGREDLSLTGDGARLIIDQGPCQLILDPS